MLTFLFCFQIMSESAPNAPERPAEAETRSQYRFKAEIVPVEIPVRKGEPVFFSEDEFIRPGTTADSLTLVPS